MDAFLCILDFFQGHCKTLRGGCLRFGSAPTQTLTQGCQRRRGDEQIYRIEIGLLDLADTLRLWTLGVYSEGGSTARETHLRLNVQDAATPRACDLPDCERAGAIEVARELGVLDEGTLLEQLLELVAGDKVVLLAVLLARTRSARRVCRRWVRRTAPRHYALRLSHEKR